MESLSRREQRLIAVLAAVVVAAAVYLGALQPLLTRRAEMRDEVARLEAQVDEWRKFDEDAAAGRRTDAQEAEERLLDGSPDQAPAAQSALADWLADAAGDLDGRVLSLRFEPAEPVTLLDAEEDRAEPAVTVATLAAVVEFRAPLAGQEALLRRLQRWDAVHLSLVTFGWQRRSPPSASPDGAPGPEGGDAGDGAGETDGDQVGDQAGGNTAAASGAAWDGRYEVVLYLTRKAGGSD